MFFTSLLPLLNKGVSVQLTLQSQDDKILLDVLPTGAAAAQLVPKQFIATAEELDAGITEILAGYSQVNVTLAEQLAAAAAVADALAKDAAKAATTSKKSASKARTPASSADSESAPGAGEEEDSLGDSGAGTTSVSTNAAAPAAAAEHGQLGFVL